MMQRNRQRCAAIPALVIGLLSIKEGGSVLLGLSTPAYPVLQWLVLYNVVLGFVSIAAAIGMWTQRRWAGTLAVMILSLHGLVFLALVTLFALGKTVASISIMAMLFRTTLWLVIVALLLWKKQAHGGTA